MSSYRLWIRIPKDISSILRIVKLTSPQYRGVWKALMALSFDIDAVIESDEGQNNPHKPNMRSVPIRGDYYAFFDPSELKQKTLYQIGQNVIPSAFRNNPRYWVVFENPFRNSSEYGSHFIIPYKHFDELTGIFKVFEWLGLDPIQYCLRIENNNGNPL